MYKNPNASALAIALHVDDAYDRLLLDRCADDGCPNTGDDDSPWNKDEPPDDPGAGGVLIAA